jgi:hypothetical protein
MEEDSESVWLYYRDRLESQVVPESAFATGQAERFQREFVRLRFQPDLGGLDVTAAVQNGRILAWQQTTPNTAPAFWHFYSNLFAELDEESPEYKSLTDFGLWPVKPGLAEKTEAKRLAVLAEQIEVQGPKIFDLYAAEFRQNFFKRKYRWFQRQWDDVVSTEALVSYLGDVCLLNAFNARSAGNEAQAQSWFDSAEQSISRAAPGSPVRAYLESRLADMRKNPGSPLTMLIHTYSLFYIRQRMSLSSEDREPLSGL